MQDDSTNPDVVEIDSLLTSLTDAVRTGDGEAVTSLLSDDPVAIFTGSTGRVVGSESVRDVWLRHLTSWNDVELKRRETVVRIHGDVAWATFLWDGVGGQDGETYRVNGERWSIVVVWEDGRWRIAQTHASLPYTDWASLRDNA